MDGEIKISAFTIIWNPIKWQYPIIESIKAMLPLVDEIVVVDGGSTDGSIESIGKLSSKIRIVSDPTTLWEDDWTYSRMGKNWARGFDECTGDWIIKFDADYIVDNEYDFRGECLLVNKESYSLHFSRYNFQLIDRYFLKNTKTWAVNKTLCNENNIDIRWGYDIPRWGLCDEAIIYKETHKDGTLHGDLLNTLNKDKMLSQIKVYNYAYCFRNEENTKQLMFKNMRAMERQRGNSFNKTPERVLEDYKRACGSAFNNSKQYLIKFKEHPLEIRDKIQKLSPDQQGYNYWGGYEKAKYYD